MKNRLLIIILFLATFFFSLSCKKPSKDIVINNDKNELITNLKINKKAIPDSLYFFGNGFKIQIIDKKLLILDVDSNPIFENKNIIKRKDENHNCMSDGFQKIISRDDYFTIEQQNCSNKFFINEYITFRYYSDLKKIYLSKIKYVYINKSNPNDIIPEKKFTPNHFGKIKIEDVNLSLLYVDLVNKN